MAIVTIEDSDRHQRIGPYEVAVKARGDHCMDFTVYKMYVGTGEVDEQVADGHVKWDHCANVNYAYDAGNVAMIHFCEVEQMREYHEALELAYSLASEVVPRWD